MTLTGRRVVLGVSGGIACYKTCTVARRLTEMGAEVDVVLTGSATRFVGAATFEALTDRPVLTSLWEPGVALEHVRLGAADLIVLAPATAHLLARAALGLADDFLTALLLAADGPVLVAPAMNDRMFDHPATRQNLATLRERGWHVIGPAIGPLAEGPAERPGRMSEPEEIVAAAERLLRGRDSALGGRRVLITAGPTREPLDPVRVITNRSSGRMGYELAAAAYARGGQVTLLTGPTTLAPPPGVDVVRIESTTDLERAVVERLPDTELLVMAAAPSDFRPASAHPTKRPRREGPHSVLLEPTDDVLESTRDHRREGCVVVGFALETDQGVERAREKLVRKGLDLIVLNMATEPDAGFEAPTNRVTLIDEERAAPLPLLPKREVAEKILDAAMERM